jgi:uncharacterized protein
MNGMRNPKRFSMTPKKIWANLTVKDARRSAAFYSKLGLKTNISDQMPNSGSVTIGEHGFMINFFGREQMEYAMSGRVADASQANEIIFSLSADTKEEVGEWTETVRAAGGTVVKEPGKDRAGYYYCVFADPDGHKFNVLLMEPGM